MILAKSNSTVHIPSFPKSKNERRVYACFDTNNSHKMFGYRVCYREDMVHEKAANPSANQTYKPLYKFTKEIVHELARAYEVMPKYWT